MRVETLSGGFAAAMMLLAAAAAAENTAMPSIDLPNPYPAGTKFGQLPDGRLSSRAARNTPAAACRAAHLRDKTETCVSSPKVFPLAFV